MVAARAVIVFHVHAFGTQTRTNTLPTVGYLELISPWKRRVSATESFTSRRALESFSSGTKAQIQQLQTVKFTSQFCRWPQKKKRRKGGGEGRGSGRSHDRRWDRRTIDKTRSHMFTWNHTDLSPHINKCVQAQPAAHLHPVLIRGTAENSPLNPGPPSFVLKGEFTQKWKLIKSPNRWWRVTSQNVDEAQLYKHLR